MHRLRPWILQRSDALFSGNKKKKQNEQIPSGLPVLESQRTRPLTPGSSPEEPCKGLEIAVTKCLFYSKLPPELRFQILILAFGSRTVHLDLRFRRENPKISDPKEGTVNHAGIDAFEAQDLTDSNSPEPAAWRWWSSVCHRNPREDAWMDRCHAGLAACYLFPGTEPEKCLIGISGWLLSCRQCYCDGINVLYSTNTIHISSRAVLGNFPSLILPRRLAMIRSLELLCDYNLLHDAVFRKQRSNLHDAWDAFEQLLGLLECTFLSLSKMYFSIQKQIDRAAGKSTKEDLKQVEKVLARFDKTMSHFASRSQRVSLEVAMPYSFFDAVKQEAIIKNEGMGVEGRKVWRLIDPSSQGYWVSMGESDAPLTSFNCG